MLGIFFVLHYAERLCGLPKLQNKGQGRNKKVVHLCHFWTNFNEILAIQIFLTTWNACRVSSRMLRPQGQRPQGHKGQVNFFRIQSFYIFASGCGFSKFKMRIISAAIEIANCATLNLNSPLAYMAVPPPLNIAFNFISWKGDHKL